MPLPKRRPAAEERITSTRSGTSETPRVCKATTPVRVERRAAASWARCGHRCSTATAVGNEPPNPFHTSGNAHRARLINRRRCRLPSITAVPRRTDPRRNASCAGSTGRSGCRSKTSPARANTSASITSLLCLPLIAPRSRAACRAPNNDRSQPASAKATDNPSQVIEVGSATATTPGIWASRPVNDRSPANVGCTWNRSVRTRPSASAARTQTSCCATIAASIPTRTSRGGSLLP